MASTDSAERLEFDVASIKPAYTGSFGPFDSERFPRSNVNLDAGNKYIPTGGTFRAANQQLAKYIAFAYKMNGSEELAMRAAAPKWIESMRFDIEARSATPNPTKDELRLMMRSLLADRFKLVVHKEVRQLPVYALTLATPGKLGPQIRQHRQDDQTCSAPDSLEAMSAFRMPTLDDGFPAVCGWITYMMASSGPNIKPSGRNVSMALIASMLPAMGNTGLDRPVIDQTGLTGTFDFALELPFVPGSITQNDQEDSSPGLLDGLRNQLGLKLKRENGPVEVYIIDHIEQPTPN